MAHFKQIPATIQSVIQQKLGELTSPLLESLGSSRAVVSLHETVDVWLLPASAIAQSSNSLRRLAKSTGQYHHQLKANGVPVAYGRTRSHGADPADWSVEGVFHSTPFSQKFEAAIESIDQAGLSDDLQVRVLSVPAFQIQAFWLIDTLAPDDDSRQLVVVVDAPAEYGFELQTKRYTLTEFLGKLRQVRHVQGLA